MDVVRNILGKNYKKNDWDLDGVKNKKDCQPRNPMRQDKLNDIMDNVAKTYGPPFNEIVFANRAKKAGYSDTEIHIFLNGPDSIG